MISIIIMIFVLIPLVLVFLNKYFMSKLKCSFEKKTSYECGFNSVNGVSRVSFSMNFYIFTIVFLLFDMEIALLIPCVFVLEFEMFYMLEKINFLCFVYLNLIFSVLLEYWMDNLYWSK